MALQTYDDLKTSVAAWIDRSDLTTVIPDFITLAETDILRWLRVWWNEKRAYTVPTTPFVELPSDYIGMRNVQWNYSNYRVPLEQVSPEGMDKLEMYSDTGVPAFYSIQDGQIELRPAPSSDNTTQIEIAYYFKPTALSDSNSTNEILDNAPDLLLYASCMQAFSYMRDEMNAKVFMDRYLTSKSSIQRSSSKAVWGEGNALRMRPM